MLERLDPRFPRRRTHSIKDRASWLRPGPLAAAGGALALAGLAGFVHGRTGRAEADNPPLGRFVEVEGVRLHYVERGAGEPLVLLHGNGSLVEELLISGLVDGAAGKYRVIAFDRPGFGHSSRPRSRIWTPEAQARLLRLAFDRLGIERPIVLGHSWGTQVALALGLHHRLAVKSLLLMAGYYYPTPRLDVPLLSPPAIPGIGDALRFTVSPVLTRLLWPVLVRKIFAPNEVPEHFRAFPKWMALRPGQIRAGAAETALMIPSAARLSHHYSRLNLPVVIVTGDRDEVTDPQRQSHRLHAELANSTLRVVPGVGHMVHHIALDAVLDAIDAAAALGSNTAAWVRQPA